MSFYRFHFKISVLMDFESPRQPRARATFKQQFTKLCQEAIITI